mmetsp:Transcript_4136/g.6795  ORF Transcript_4136/g.6795 Transcript_4136/m.6795 type:complete len:264 (-) Transcript_4136:2617-3408(-)
MGCCLPGGPLHKLGGLHRRPGSHTPEGGHRTGRQDVHLAPSARILQGQRDRHNRQRHRILLAQEQPHSLMLGGHRTEHHLEEEDALKCIGKHLGRCQRSRRTQWLLEGRHTLKIAVATRSLRHSPLQQGGRRIHRTLGVVHHRDARGRRRLRNHQLRVEGLHHSHLQRGGRGRMGRHHLRCPGGDLHAHLAALHAHRAALHAHRTALHDHPLIAGSRTAVRCTGLGRVAESLRTGRTVKREVQSGCLYRNRRHPCRRLGLCGA